MINISNFKCYLYKIIYILMNYKIKMSLSYTYYTRLFCFIFNIFQIKCIYIFLKFFSTLFTFFIIIFQYLLFFHVGKKVTCFYVRLEQDMSRSHECFVRSQKVKPKMMMIYMFIFGSKSEVRCHQEH